MFLVIMQSFYKSLCVMFITCVVHKVVFSVIFVLDLYTFDNLRHKLVIFVEYKNFCSRCFVCSYLKFFWFVMRDQAECYSVLWHCFVPFVGCSVAWTIK
jgi:hypothetical protein